ncbi:uncharacterized [Tachysurus ichikawai]
MENGGMNEGPAAGCQQEGGSSLASKAPAASKYHPEWKMPREVLEISSECRASGVPEEQREKRRLGQYTIRPGLLFPSLRTQTLCYSTLFFSSFIISVNC